MQSPNHRAVTQHRRCSASTRSSCSAAARPASRPRSRPAASGRSTLLIERYGFLGGAGTAAGLSTFCGLHAVVHGKHEQVVHGIADDILDRLRAMDGLNKPHLTIRDQILAQAYDISAFKIAADELLAEAKVNVLFHAFAVGARARVGRRASTRCSSRRSRAASRCAARSSSTAPATATSPRGPACRTRSATA